MMQPGGRDTIKNPFGGTEAVFKPKWRDPLVAMGIWNTRFYVNRHRNEQSGVDSGRNDALRFLRKRPQSDRAITMVTLSQPLVMNDVCPLHGQ